MVFTRFCALSLLDGIGGLLGLTSAPDGAFEAALADCRRGGVCTDDLKPNVRDFVTRGDNV